MGFPRQYWSGLPFPTSRDFPNPGIELWTGRFFTTEPSRKCFSSTDSIKQTLAVCLLPNTLLLNTLQTFALLSRITGVAAFLTEEETGSEKFWWPAKITGRPSWGVFGRCSPPLLLMFSALNIWSLLGVPSLSGHLPCGWLVPELEEIALFRCCSLFYQGDWILPAAAAAAKSLQSCPTLCNPIDSSPPGSAVPRILQAGVLEWIAISFSNAWKWKVKVKSLSPVRLCATPWTAAYQAPLSMGFSRQRVLEWGAIAFSGILPTWR